MPSTDFIFGFFVGLVLPVIVILFALWCDRRAKRSDRAKVLDLSDGAAPHCLARVPSLHSETAGMIGHSR